MFNKKAKKRAIFAYSLLISSIFIISLGFLIFFRVISYVTPNGDTSEVKAPSSEVKAASANMDFQQIVQLVAMAVMLIFIFFVVQILLKLYRYNILISDFYFACEDALIMAEKYDSAKLKKFESLVKCIQPEKITLESESIPDIKTITDLIKNK